MSEDALTPLATATTVQACQAECAADAACQYYVFRAAARISCLLRNKVPYSKVDLNDTSKSYALFEVSLGVS